MSKTLRAAALLLVAFAILAIGTSRARAEEKMVGVVAKIELAADGKSADVTLTDNKTGEPFHVLVNDDLTLDKFKDHRIVDGDEVRVKYESQEGRTTRPTSGRRGMLTTRIAVLSTLLLAWVPAPAAEHPGRERIEKSGYQGPATCEECHPGTAKAFLATVHWTHASQVENVENVDPAEPTG